MKCFACDKPINSTPHTAVTVDGQSVYVGPSCFTRIRKLGNTGYQPPLGGPKLYLNEFIENVMSEGRLARMDGHPIASNPYKDKDNPLHESWTFQAWNTGWIDADTDPNAPKQPIY